MFCLVFFIDNSYLIMLLNSTNINNSNSNLIMLTMISPVQSDPFLH